MGIGVEGTLNPAMQSFLWVLVKMLTKKLYEPLRELRSRLHLAIEFPLPAQLSPTSQDGQHHDQHGIARTDL